MSSCVEAANPEMHTSLSDGTLRRSFATTVEHGILAPISGLSSAPSECKSFGQESETLRALVDMASSAFVHALDAVCSFSEPFESKPQNGEQTQYKSVSDIANHGKHLEHFHLYTKQFKESKSEPITLEMHTDAGLFIAMTPALNIGESTESEHRTGFFIQLANGDVTYPSAPRDSLIFMVGQGSKQWLNPKFSPKCALRPTPHGVDLKRHDKPTLTRGWYGRMFMLPADAMITADDQTIPFGKYLALQQQAVAAGAEPTLHDSDHFYTALGANSDPLSTSASCDTCDNPPCMMCWMACMSIKGLACGDKAECLDPAHNNKPYPGPPAMCPTCKPVCPPTPPPTPKPLIPTPEPTMEPTLEPEEMFCKTDFPNDMYMTGFVSLSEMPSNQCLIFLFKEWCIDTRGKYWIAFFGIYFAALGNTSPPLPGGLHASPARICPPQPQIKHAHSHLTPSTFTSHVFHIRLPSLLSFR
jgi:hypothetical protein